MKNPIRQALTKTIRTTHKRKQIEVKVAPSERLLYAVYFSLGMVACLTVLEAVHIIVLGKWNAEIFNAISLLVGNITGIFLTQKT
ncbi:MAG: hypothetical protein ACQXXG_02195 [Candidatus Bathyarchaeia archaeon]|jgi:hypothetical protein|nr:hypothetical protein [Candidatus Bathyarchaeota archaeon A05DMB-3]